MKIDRRALILAAACLAPARPAAAAGRREIDRDVANTLRALPRTAPEAHGLLHRAVAVLVFPRVTKAGLMIGGEYGEGALRRGDRTVAYYRLAAASYGLQLGAQTYSYLMLMMNEEAVRYLDRSDGWEIGSGPSAVLVDQGMAARMTSTTITQDVLVFTFGQSGLMAGIGIQGTRITRFEPGR